MKTLLAFCLSINGTLSEKNGKWQKYECKGRSIKDCMEMAANLTHLDSVQNDFDVDYDMLANYNAKRISAPYAMSFANVARPSEGRCKVTEPAIPGGPCCLEAFSRLEPDLKYPQYYLQCSSTQKDDEMGQWVRMQCPDGLVFDSPSQMCINSISASAQGSGSGRKIPSEYNNANLNPFSTMSQNYLRPSYTSCPDGSTAKLNCLNGQCPTGQKCINNLCCEISRNVCDDGTVGIKSCTKNEECTLGYYCAQNKRLCCRLRTSMNNPRSFTYALSIACPAALNSIITLCNSAYQCPAGSTCITSLGVCCPVEQAPGSGLYAQCPDDTKPLTGSWCMTSNQCPAGYYCPISTRACCSLPNQMASSLMHMYIEGTCPDGTAALAYPTKCTSNTQCPMKCYCALHLNSCCVLPVVPPPQPANFRFCPDGSPATSISCTVDSTCPNGYYCPGSLGYCCRIPSNTGICPDGSEAAGFCVRGLCGNGFSCITEMNICCPRSGSGSISIGICPDGSAPTHTCTHGQCMPDYVCLGGVCCPQLTNKLPCLDGSQPIGLCINGRCGNGFVCTDGNYCCRQISSPGLPRCADGSTAFCQCSNGRCPMGLTCTDKNICCPQSQGIAKLCPDGSQPVSSCLGGQCSLGFYCVSNVCCATSLIETKLCPNGLQPQGKCVKGQCGPGFTCTADNVCCPVSIIPGLCPDGKQPAGACINGLCGAGFTCLAGANICCTGATQPTFCLDGTIPVGPCVNGLCGVGFTCTTGNLCCPQGSFSPGIGGVCGDGSKSVGPCIGGLCAIGYSCTPENFCCQDDGPPVTDICPDGSLPTESCTADFQCSRQSLICIDGYNCCPLTGGVETGSCPAGTMYYGLCVNSLCPDGMQCISGQCCGPPTTSKAFLTSDTGSGRVPIAKSPGSKCTNSEECNGAKSKLASCHNQLCTCLTPAKPMRGTCVLRPPPKASGSNGEFLDLIANDSPISEEIQRVWRNCTSSAECNKRSHEKCISGVCISPRAPGEPCSDNAECMLNCAASSCQKRADRKICVCAENLYRYKRHCMKKCPQGTQTRKDKNDCEDTAYSMILQDNASFGSEIRLNSAC
ncbi:Uncharacterized protein T01_13562 [Trichinella spiralis]|uniref:CC domain-containing protein n=1 Tax=Trichinella spiralis TaxID=6334 RepID=A0A0V1BW22_TRISP|nr:Uncharacterized protein T01_13562 [Trichinella spiralis]